MLGAIHTNSSVAPSSLVSDPLHAVTIEKLKTYTFRQIWERLLSRNLFPNQAACGNTGITELRETPRPIEIMYNFLSQIASTAGVTLVSPASLERSSITHLRASGDRSVLSRRGATSVAKSRAGNAGLGTVVPRFRKSVTAAEAAAERMRTSVLQLPKATEGKVTLLVTEIINMVRGYAQNQPRGRGGAGAGAGAGAAAGGNDSVVVDIFQFRNDLLAKTNAFAKEVETSIEGLDEKLKEVSQALKKVRASSESLGGDTGGGGGGDDADATGGGAGGDEGDSGAGSTAQPSGDDQSGQPLGAAFFRVNDAIMTALNEVRSILPVQIRFALPPHIPGLSYKDWDANRAFSRSFGRLLATKAARDGIMVYTASQIASASQQAGKRYGYGKQIERSAKISTKEINNAHLAVAILRGSIELDGDPKSPEHRCKCREDGDCTCQ